MVDVSKYIVAGNWTLIPYGKRITICDGTQYLVIDEAQMRDLAQLVQMWIERNAEVEE